MKKSLAVGALVGMGLILSSCGAGVRVGATYGSDSRWHRQYYGDRHYGPQYRGYVYIAPSDQIKRLSQDYGMKHASAAKVISLTNGQNPEAELAALNLKKEDFLPLANLQMPSQESIRKVADALNENEEVVGSAMQDFLQDIQAEQSAIPTGSND